MMSGLDPCLVRRASENGIPYTILHQRIYLYDFDEDRAVTEPIKVDARTKKLSRKITFKGETLTVRQWSRELGIPERTIKSRLYSGMSEEEALSKPYNVKSKTRTRPNTLHEFNGKKQTLKQWALDLGVSYSALTTSIGRTKSKTLAEAACQILKRGNNGCR